MRPRRHLGRRRSFGRDWVGKSGGKTKVDNDRVVASRPLTKVRTGQGGGEGGPTTGADFGAPTDKNFVVGPKFTLVSFDGRTDVCKGKIAFKSVSTIILDWNPFFTTI